MDRFEGRIAVVTGGGHGMGQELVRQLAAAGCHVATCDVHADALDETRRLADETAPAGTRVTTFVADVSDEAQVLAFADAVRRDHDTDRVHLLFNNAGIAGGGSIVADDRAEWERTFGVDWYGVYHGTRAFLPLLLAAEEGHVVNTSSINGLWASVGPATPHTAYSAAKFAVRGFTEALITDFRVNAPHLRASVVLPGHIGTSIIANTARAHGNDPASMDAAQLARTRDQLAQRGFPVADLGDEDLRKGLAMMAEGFKNLAPVSAAEAAGIILEGVRANRWRILVGKDAHLVDDAVRADPEAAYEPEFFAMLRERGAFGLLP